MGGPDQTLDIAMRVSKLAVDQLRHGYESMAKPERRSSALADLDETLLQGLEGVAQDTILESGEWDFDWRVPMPVGVWHGTKDTDVPVAAAEFYVRFLPRAEGKIIEGES